MQEMSKMIFKIWNQTRTKKHFISVDDTEDLYEQVVLKGKHPVLFIFNNLFNVAQMKFSASSKLDINGSSLVVESDGTVVDETDVLRSIKNEVLILLQPNEEWIPSSQICDDSDTLTTNSSILNEITNTIDIDNIDNEEFQTQKNIKATGHSRVTEIILPWEKLSDFTRQKCEAGERDRRAISDVIHMAITEMQKIDQLIPSKNIKIVAQKIVSKYPAVFQDTDDDGVVIGDGMHSTYNKLVDHNNYLNKPHKTPSPISDITGKTLFVFIKSCQLILFYNTYFRLQYTNILCCCRTRNNK